ncbi:hypothetical protein ACMGE7_09785 [Macrococcus equi]|uniref:hypothetical protein n=1 Tax=Macrococcus equi TaxID=3395462 RepID=UPI0039BDFB5C
MYKAVSLLLMGLLWIVIGLIQWHPDDHSFTILYGAIGVVFLFFAYINYRKAAR